MPQIFNEHERAAIKEDMLKVGAALLRKKRHQEHICRGHYERCWHLKRCLLLIFLFTGGLALEDRQKGRAPVDCAYTVSGVAGFGRKGENQNNMFIYMKAVSLIICPLRIWNIS